MLTEVTIDWTMTHYTDPTGADLVRALQNDVRSQTSPYPPDQWGSVTPVSPPKSLVLGTLKRCPSGSHQNKRRNSPEPRQRVWRTSSKTP